MCFFIGAGATLPWGSPLTSELTTFYFGSGSFKKRGYRSNIKDRISKKMGRCFLHKVYAVIGFSLGLPKLTSKYKTKQIDFG
ncbi:hypothetical protein ABIC84_005009 [Mucilaginibacter sp. 3215]